MENQFMKQKLLLLFLSYVLALSLSSCAFQDDSMPDLYEDVEWVEIDKNEAVEIWKNYDTHTMRSGTLTIWQKWCGTKPQKFLGCSIDGDTYENAEGLMLSYCIGRLTVNPAEESENAVFYKMKDNTSIIKIEKPVAGTDSFNYLDVYKDGWCIVKNKYNGVDSYEKLYIKYDWY